MVSAMKAVHFNSSTIEALMEALYELNKKLLLREGKMLRLATSCGVKEDFIEQYLNLILRKIGYKLYLLLKKKIGKNLSIEIISEINKLVEEIKEIQTASELPLPEFRRIVSTVQNGEEISK